MLLWVGRRLAGSLLLVIVVSGLLFAAVELLPGDVATQILGPNAGPGRVAALRQELSLDDPAVVRYGHWLTGVVQGDLGNAATTDRSVVEIIGDRVLNSAVLAGVTFVVVAFLALGLGIVTGRCEASRTDVTISTAVLGAVSIPEFVIAGLLVTGIALTLGWLPAVSLVPIGGTPLDRPAILVLPVASLAVVGAAFGSRLIRAAVVDVCRSPHVGAARLAGLPERQVLLRHVVPLAAGPIAQVLAFTVPYLIGGTVVVEQVFSYPGLGTLLVEQVNQRDTRVVQAIGVLMASTVVAAFLVADLVGYWLSPRHGGPTSDRPRHLQSRGSHWYRPARTDHRGAAGPSGRSGADGGRRRAVRSALRGGRTGRGTVRPSIGLIIPGH